MRFGMRRGAVAAGGVLLSVVLVGCSSGSAERNEDSADTTTSGSTSSASAGSAIPNPKDATAVDVCELLPEDVATQLGVQPEGKKRDNVLGATETDNCTWKSQGGLISVAMSPVKDRSLDTYYNNQSEYVDFERITVQGNPGVRANKVKPMGSGSCGMFLATQQSQLVQSFAILQSEEAGVTDPCALAKKALRLSLPSWPAAE
ncbi:DUF3558 family protein [Actinopolyspora erythraea]|uniref:DUF3558 family protein n=1 Tax=Actinopolyspora erythraea TaxID=414996 RepID=UPI000AB8D2F5|nr:DUF3558 family protein [Actinopolyspora erythraea]